MRSNLSEEITVVVIGAIVGAIASAVVNRIITADIGYWWLWILVGIVCALFIVVIYHFNNSKVITYGSKAAIQTDDKNFVTSDSNHGNQLIGRAKRVGAWQVFEIVEADRPYSQEKYKVVHYGDHVALRAINTNQYVGAKLDSENELVSWANQLRGPGWETFTLDPPPNASGGQKEPVRYRSSFALLAYNKMYVRCALWGDDGRLLAVASKIDTWETFTFVNPYSLTNTLKKVVTGQRW
jgi:uncharacterized membrane protein YeaQ/YmgE (transglycosylase-associated protein family)